MKEIYFDNAATTPILDDVVKAMQPFLTSEFGNPSSAYSIGRRVRKALDDARDTVADIIGAEPKEITFCSCATESICTSIVGAAMNITDKKRFVTSATEHKAVLKTGKWLTEHLGWELTLINAGKSGHVDVDEFLDACTGDCGIASLMWVNNEIGTIQPVEKVARGLKGKGVIFHTDATQALGKLEIDVRNVPVDILSASGHKFYAPKGVGVTFIRDGSLDITPIMVGGGQELEHRAGTENVTGIVGLATALKIVSAGANDFLERMKSLEVQFLHHLDEAGIEYEINGDEPRMPGLMSIFFTGVEAESLLLVADRAGVCISAGSACSAGSTQPSYVLESMGHGRMRSLCSVRVSFGWHNTPAEVDEGVKRIIDCVKKLRGKT